MLIFSIVTISLPSSFKQTKHNEEKTTLLGQLQIRYFSTPKMINCLFLQMFNGRVSFRLLMSSNRLFSLVFKKSESWQSTYLLSRAM